MGYNRRESWLRILVLIIPIGGLFTAGAVVTVLQSFGILAPLTMLPSAQAWIDVFTDGWIWTSIIHSLAISMASAACAVILGTVMAWGIHRLPNMWFHVAMIYKIPLILPYLTIAYIAIIFFGQSGIISSLLANMGIIKATGDFPNIIYSGHGIGVGLAYIMKGTSFVILMAMGLLHKLDENLISSARMLGASPFAIFRDIVIPHLKPTMVSSFVILCLYALGAFEVPWLIGESRPQMLSITVYNLYFQRDLSRRPEATALLSMLMLISFLLIYAVFLAGRRRGKAIKTDTGTALIKAFHQSKTKVKRGRWK